MKKHLVFAVVPFLALGCGDELKDENGDGIADGVREPDSVTVVTPATPKGTVSGQVLGTDLKPLSEASVKMTIGSSADPVAATTDAEGNFEFKDVPAGSQVLLTFTKQGYATLRASSTVPSSAGNVPINNGNASFGPITLAKLDGTLNFLLVTPQGRPAANVKAVLEATPAGSIILSNYENTSQVVSTVVVEATSNEQGALTFSGIPSSLEMARLYNNSSGAGQYKLWVSPMDSNNDGIPETGGYVNSYSGQNVVENSTIRVINLPYSRPTNSALSVQSSNVASLTTSAERLDPLRNMVRPGEPIYLYFNQPVQSGSLLVRMTDEYARELLTVNASVGNAGYSATITPATSIVEGREYNLDVRAVSAEGGSIFTSKGFFFAGDQLSPRSTSITDARYQETTLPPNGTAAQINDGERVYINFSAPIARTFTGDSLHVQVFFDMDIDNSGSRNLFGELGNPSGRGFDLVIDEPTAPYVTRTPPETSVFGILTSGYSTRYSFVYSNPSAPGTLPPLLTNGNLPMVVTFSKLGSRGISGTYENIWGQPLTADLTVTNIATQPAPTP